MRIITNNKKLPIYAPFIVAVLILIVGCSEYIEAEVEEDSASGDSQITGAAVTEILRACKYSTGDFCSEKCCIGEKNCNNEPAYAECNLKTGEWETSIYKDSECASKCEQKETTADSQSKDFKEETNTSKCTQEWKCVEEKYRGYQLSDCSWEALEQCDYKCEDGECKSKPFCIPDSLKCDDKTLLKCDENGKEWILYESCTYGCEDKKCTSAISGGSGGGGSANEPSQNDFISDNCISVLNFNYAPAGNNLSNEYFTLKNSCSYSIDMSGWTAKDNATTSHIFTFPVFNLNVNAELSVHTGNGTNTSTDLYFRKKSAVWNNDGDTLYLNTSNGTSVLICPYPNNGSILNCPDL